MWHGAGDFVGRERELSVLSDCAAQVACRRPCSLLIEGDSGIGKSTLVRHWLQSGAAFEHPTVLWATCDPEETNLPFGAVEQLTARAPLAAASTERVLGENGLVGTPSFHIGMRLLDLLSLLQDNGPVVVVVDDVQWVDEASLKVFGFVLRRLEADMVMTVMLARSGRRPAELLRNQEVKRLIAGQPLQVQLTLEGLQTAETAQLVERTTGHGIADSAAEELRVHTGGNPLHLHSVLDEMPDEWLSQTRTPLPVPSTLADLVREQLGSLTDPARRIVEAAAVVGGRVPLALAAEIADVAAPSTALEPGLRAGLLEWWPTEPTTPIAISHPLRREAVIAAITPQDRRRLHRRAATRVAASASWAHRVAAADSVDGLLAAELEAEARRQFGRGAAERAATLLLWASNLVAERADRERLLLTSACELLWNDNLITVKPLIESVRSCEPSDLRDLALGAYALSRGALANAEVQLSEVWDNTRARPGQEETAVMAGTWLAIAYIYQIQAEQALGTLRDVIALVPPDSPLSVRARANLPYARSLAEGLPAGLAELSRIASVGAARPTTAADTYLLAYRGTLRSFAGELTAGVDDLTHALSRAQAEGHPVLAEVHYRHLAVAQYMLGAWDAAAVSAGHAVSIASAEDKPWAMAGAYAVNSLVPASRGDWDSAEEQLALARHRAESFGPDYSLIFVAVAAANLAAARDDPAGMLSALLPLLGLPEHGTASVFRAWWLPLYTEALIRNDRPEESHAALADLDALCLSAPYLQVTAARLHGHLAERRVATSDALNHYRRGLDAPVGTDDPVLHRALLEHAFGKLLATGGNRGQGEAFLSRAQDRLTALGAVPYLARCENDLTSFEMTPSERAVPGAADDLPQLTDRERDIARLIDQGMTNKEIANSLFISAKTVEYHLGNLYTKLGLTGRRQLRELIRHQG